MKNVVFSVLAFALSAPALAGGSSTVGPGNPASIACVKAGGTLQLISDERGQAALCVFGKSSGSGAIEEWTLWRYKDSGRSMAVEAFFADRHDDTRDNGGIGLANPASVNCINNGGKLAIYNTEGGEIGLCGFSDRSAIEEWTLFRGPTDKLNAKLVKALRK